MEKCAETGGIDCAGKSDSPKNESLLAYLF